MSNSYVAINVLNLIEIVGEEAVQNALQNFTCPINPEIEQFAQNRAVDFSKRKMSITHIILDEKSQIVAYYTLAHKPSSVPVALLSNSSKKKLERYAKLDEKTEAYEVSAFLLAQFGKNKAVEAEISGNLMMEMALDTLKTVQHEVGGGVVFVECEDKKELLQFYQNDSNRFLEYGERFSETEHVLYKQLMRFF